jgi:hypothetical protein
VDPQVGDLEADFAELTYHKDFVIVGRDLGELRGGLGGRGHSG